MKAHTSLVTCTRRKKQMGQKEIKYRHLMGRIAPLKLEEKHHFIPWLIQNLFDLPIKLARSWTSSLLKINIYLLSLLQYFKEQDHWISQPNSTWKRNKHVGKSWLSLAVKPYSMVELQILWHFPTFKVLIISLAILEVFTSHLFSLTQRSPKCVFLTDNKKQNGIQCGFIAATQVAMYLAARMA